MTLRYDPPFPFNWDTKFSPGSDDQGGNGPGREGDNELWQVGDIAECVSDGQWFSQAFGIPHRAGPQRGERFAVKAVSDGVCAILGPVQMLGFAEFDPKRFSAPAFRKVRPIADESIAADAAFASQLGFAPTKVEEEAA